MSEKEFRYDRLKSWPKRIRQALFRFCIYGALLVAGEVAFYTITKVGRLIPVLSALFHYDWEVDPALCLGQIWSVPIMTFFGQASLYMFFVYGAICVVGLEPAYRAMKKKDVPIFFRGIVYMVIILFMECTLGWVLKFLTGYDIWIYYGPGTLFTYTSLAIAPMWFICGLISENVISLIDSFDDLKMNVYGLGGFRGRAAPGGKRDKIVFVSDVHIGPRNDDGSPAGWFYGFYEIYFTIMLYKIALDPRVKELVFVGDLFDTWLYPPEERPESISAIIERWKDSPFMAPLRDCVRKCEAVWYIAGNHDMHVRQGDLGALSVDGKQITLITKGDFAALSHLGGGTELRAEHGNDGDFFNAPDHDPDTVQGMPFGYFVSRLVSAAEDFDIDQTFRAAYAGLRNMGAPAVEGETDDHRAGRLFIHAFVDALVLHANSKRDPARRIGDDTVILMPEGYSDTTIREVKGHYSSLLGNWLKNRQTYMFAAAGKNGLDEYARKMFGKRDWSLWLARLFSRLRRPELIVVMGHTHYGLKERVLDRERQGIYANTGCVCKNSKQTGVRWVEIRDTSRGCAVTLKRL